MREIRYGQALNEALREEMERDPTVFVAGEDVACYEGGPFGVTRGLKDLFGAERVRDTPISETAIVGLAVGASATGMRPVVEIMFMDFVAVCMDQIVNQAAKMRYMFGGRATLPMVIRTQAGAGVGAGPQHSQCLEAWFAHVPGLKVVAPATPYDAKGLLKSAIRDPNPVVFIEGKTLYAAKGELPETEYLIPLGQADVKRPGTDLTIVTWSQMLRVCLKAADILATTGIDAEVVDLRTISPLDVETILNSVQKTGRLLVVHEAVRNGGLGAEIVATVTEQALEYLDVPPRRVAAPFTPVPFSPGLEKAYMPGAEQVVSAAAAMLGKSA